MQDIETVVKCEIKDEKDVYGHLNNADYPRYFEKGRIALLNEYGITDEDLSGNGRGLLMTKSSIDFRSPVTKGQEVEIHSRFEDYDGGLYIYIGHEMRSGGNVIATAENEFVFVRLEGNMLKATRPLEELVFQLREPS